MDDNAGARSVVRGWGLNSLNLPCYLTCTNRGTDHTPESTMNNWLPFRCLFVILLSLSVSRHGVLESWIRLDGGRARWGDADAETSVF